MSARGIPGGGCVDPLPSGRFRVRITVADGSRRTLSTYETREEAQRILNAALVELAEGNVAPVGGITLRAFGALFLDRREKRGVRNIRTDRNRWKVHVDSALFADFPLVAITGRMVREWRDELSRKRAADLRQGVRRQPRVLSASSVKHCVNLLRSCLEEAIDDEIIAANPARGLKVRREPTTHESWAYLTVEEQRAVEECSVAPEADRLFAMFAIGTGLRQGEQWSLELVDIHPDAKDPHVVVRYGARGRKATKSGKHRIVPLFGIAARALARWLEILPTYAPKNPFGLVFPLPGGERRDKKSYGWAHLRKAAKIDRHVRWHDLRHTFASSLVAGWWGRPWRLDEVRVLLGHSSVTTTERYAHLAPSVLAQAARETDAAQAGGHAKVTALRLIPSKPAESLGAPQRIRTSDLRLRRPSLYPAELVAL